MSGNRMGRAHDLACELGMISTPALQIFFSSTHMWFADPQIT